MMDFPNKGNVGFISLDVLADALNGRARQIQIPSFQRDAVWDENHLELLWDSLYRGYPVGSLLFADMSQLSARDDLAVRDTQVSRQQAAHPLQDDLGETQYLIIDGQQRAIAIALGYRQFQPDDSARLWIDLGAGSERLFAVCSVQRPWGRDARSSQVSQAKKHLDDRLLSPRGDLLSEQSPLKYTWPLGCKLPVPLADLLAWLDHDRPGAWRELAPEAVRDEEAHAELESIFQRLQEMRQLELPVYLVREMSTAQLGEIFQRLNKQGVSMTDQDLFFSALKLKWPQAHDLVWSIYADERTGHFMSPGEIVRLAVRLVFGTERHIARLNLDEFERLAVRDSARFDALKSWLEKEPGAPHGRLHSLLLRARTLLSYDSQDDPGLPMILLAQLPARVWHTLAAWLSRHATADDSDRQEMIRYALLDYYFSGNASQRLERIPFETAMQEDGGFPGFEIYAELWWADQLETDVPEISDVSARLADADNDDPPGHFFKKEDQLGLWTQRASLQHWFPHFDPTRFGSSKEYPYDRDHILPSAFNNLRGRTRRWQPADAFWRWRWSIITGPGNVRYWPASLNRSDQHHNLDMKHLLGPADQPTPTDSLLRAYDLETVGQVRAASQLGDDQLDNWERGANSPRPYDWSDPERIKALRSATGARRLNLYQQFYDGVGFSKWHDRFAPWLEERIREEVTKNWIGEARAAGPGEARIHARSVAEELGLHDHIRVICRALDAPEFATKYDLVLKERSGPGVGEEAVWIVRWNSDAGR